MWNLVLLHAPHGYSFIGADTADDLVRFTFQDVARSNMIETECSVGLDERVAFCVVVLEEGHDVHVTCSSGKETRR